MLGWRTGVLREPTQRARRCCLRTLQQAERRRLVLILNSPGGSIEHGRQIVAAIGALDRAIDTVVQKAGVCASMCVPIFLAGGRRIADPEAYFMFHQVSLNITARENMKRHRT